MQYYIDADWNFIYLIKGKEILKRERSLILRDLITEEVIAIGDETVHEISKPINVIAINFSENRKINSLIDFELRLHKFINNNNLYDYRFVDRYNISSLTTINTISECDYLKEIVKPESDLFIDLRENEIILFDIKKQSVKLIKKGKLFIQNIINSYFYLNYACTLNTKKTIKLIEEIKVSKKLNYVTCRSYQDGKDIKIKINDPASLLLGLKKLKDEVFEQAKKFQKIELSNNFAEVFKIVDYNNYFIFYSNRPFYCWIMITNYSKEKER